MILYYANDEHLNATIAEARLRAAGIQFARVKPADAEPWAFQLLDDDWPKVKQILHDAGLLPKSIREIGDPDK